MEHQSDPQIDPDRHLHIQWLAIVDIHWDRKASLTGKAITFEYPFREANVDWISDNFG